MRSWIRLVPSLARAVVASLALVSLTSPALADNYGADPTYPYTDRCTVGSMDSQCTNGSGVFGVFISGSVPSYLETAIETSLTDDYDPIVGIFAYREGITYEADTIVLYDDLNLPGDRYGYETCQSGTVQFVAAPNQIHSSCKHFIYFDSDMAAYLQTSDGRKHSTCHELGHNLGLRHATQGNHPNTYTNSCMRDLTTASTLDPSGSDVRHLEDFYPKP